MNKKYSLFIILSIHIFLAPRRHMMLEPNLTQSTGSFVMEILAPIGMNEVNNLFSLLFINNIYL